MYPCKQICSFNVSTTVVLYGPSCNNFVALHRDVFEILISQTSCLRLSQWSFTSSTNSIQFLLSTVCFLSAVLFSSSSVVSNSVTKLCTLCLLGSGCPEKWHQNFLQNFAAVSYLKYSGIKSRHCSTVHLTRGTLLYHWVTAKRIINAQSLGLFPWFNTL